MSVHVSNRYLYVSPFCETMYYYYFIGYLVIRLLTTSVGCGLHFKLTAALGVPDSDPGSDQNLNLSFSVKKIVIF